MKRTLEDFCRDFYHKGFLEFWYVGQNSGTVRYQDADGNVYRDTYVLVNGRPQLITSVKETT